MNPLQKTIAYFRSSKAEMEKVSWPTRKETIRYSALVIGLSISVAIFFAGLDFGLTKLVEITISTRQTPQTEQPSDIQVTPVTPDVVPSTVPSVEASTTPVTTPKL
ncbi:preprotein translocase subunit SecE [Candidatus Uhrbacteria bacterium]|nr:preprotein translocase subunit SecE [Candidatus Uhrbacteria bacterium]